MRKINPKIKAVVEEYQCPGCFTGGSTAECYMPRADCLGHGCGKHAPGTMVNPGGVIFIGMPTGFNKVGPVDLKFYSKPSVFIFKTFEEMVEQWGGYDYLNLPVWKHLDEHGHTIVRVFQPRINYGTIHIILEDCMDKVVGFICAVDITKKVMESID